MDITLRNLQRQLLSEPSPENQLAYSIAILRSGGPCQTAIEDLAEEDRPNHIQYNQDGRIVAEAICHICKKAVCGWCLLKHTHTSEDPGETGVDVCRACSVTTCGEGVMVNSMTTGSPLGTAGCGRIICKLCVVIPCEDCGIYFCHECRDMCQNQKCRHSLCPGCQIRCSSCHIILCMDPSVDHPACYSACQRCGDGPFCGDCAERHCDFEES